MYSVELENFQKFRAEARSLPKAKSMRIEIIDVTEITDTHHPLTEWPGYARNVNSFAGYGEVYWLERGRVVNMIRMNSKDAVSRAIQFTQLWLSDTAHSIPIKSQ